MAQVEWGGGGFRRPGFSGERAGRAAASDDPGVDPRGRGAPRFASSNASIAGRAFGSPLANFWRRAAAFIVSNMSRLLLLAAPSVPRPIETAASFIAG